VRYRDVATKLAALGCRELARTGGGSHRKWLNPATNRSTVVPDCGGKDLKLGTIRAGVMAAWPRLGSIHVSLNNPRKKRRRDWRQITSGKESGPILLSKYQNIAYIP
jgi:predicted RNA binding protein YcfA (HicA-like mRNA interferase family)